jgi:hypothetical protein
MVGNRLYPLVMPCSLCINCNHGFELYARLAVPETRHSLMYQRSHGMHACTAICEPSRLLVDLAEYSNLIDVRITLAHCDLAAPPMSAIFQLVWRSESGTQYAVAIA